MSTAIKNIEKILTTEFEMSQYVNLVREIFSTIKLVAPDKFKQEFSNFSSHVAGSYHVGSYVSPDNKKVAVFAVELIQKTYVENSRSTQRSFAKKLIENGGCDAALIAFYTPEDKKWRLSFVVLDYEMKIENGKMKTEENLTPARRYSYLVGDGEPCHTAISRFGKFIRDNNSQPTLEEMEEAFSVEAVTKEFFDLYCAKFYQLVEHLEANAAFKEESERCGFSTEQFAKKLMGQIVFLYFLQKKGWLGVGVWASKITEKEYNNLFYCKTVSAAQRQTIQKYLPEIYVKDGDDYKLRGLGALERIPDDVEKMIADNMPGDRNWGSGSKTFLRTWFEFSKRHEGHFYEKYLEPLFYDTLNKNRGELGYSTILHCRVPFLSGGLFEPIDNYDWRNTRIDIPDEVFSNKKADDDLTADGILDIFDRYNFTMSEDEPMEREVAIDPEMLGKVFENLLDVKDRKSKGAFYTPREIVHYMCQESLVNYINSNMDVSEEAIRSFILYGDFYKDADTEKTLKVTDANGKTHFEFDVNRELKISPEIFDPKNGVNRVGEIDELLKKIRVVDPAVGSGAFPLGMLNEIVRARQNISAYMATSMSGYNARLMYINERSAHSLKKETIKNCIFAADIEPSAVDIAQLRLWLALVIDDEINPDAQSVLDGHKNPLPLPNLECNIVCGNSLVDEFEGQKLIVQSSLLNTERAGEAFNWNQNEIEALIPRLVDAQNRLFECNDPDQKEQLKGEVAAIKDQMMWANLSTFAPEVLRKYEESKRLSSKPYVLWQIDFARVFSEKGGFDIVIGNPPYGAKFSAKDKKILSKLYEGCNVPDYESADFFIELGRRLSNKQGMLSFIIPNMFMANVFAEKYRRHLMEMWSLSKIDNLSEIDVFDSAKVRNCIVFFDAEKKEIEARFTKLTIESGSIKYQKTKLISNEKLIENIDNWLNLIEKDETALSITQKMASLSKPLSNYAEISQGLIPYDKYRGHTEEQIKNKVWNANYQKDETYRKELRGKDVDRYSLLWNGIDWISYGEWLAAPRRPEFFKNPRILVREITSPRILATYTTEEYYNTPSIINCIEFSVDGLFLLGVINSELISFYHNIMSPKASKGIFPKILVNDVRNIPINASNEEIVNEISERVKKLLEEESVDSVIDSEIDDLVYEMYEITLDEREYIKKWFDERRK